MFAVPGYVVKIVIEASACRNVYTKTLGIQHALKMFAILDLSLL